MSRSDCAKFKDRSARRCSAKRQTLRHRVANRSEFRPVPNLQMHFYHRLQCLPPQLHILIQARLASTTASSSSKGAFPFPSNPRPSPHQIFHLKHGASPEEIKARCKIITNVIIVKLIQTSSYWTTDYDLVRIHHPDSPSCRHLPPADRHSRFQAITAAYDALRKGSTVSSHFDVYAEEVARRKRAYQRQNARRAQYAAPNHYQWNSNADDRWKDHMLIAIGVLVRVILSSGSRSSVLAAVLIKQSTDAPRRRGTWDIPIPVPDATTTSRCGDKPCSGTCGGEGTR